MEIFVKFEIFILFVWLDFSQYFQPNLEVFAKFEIFILFVWLDFLKDFQPKKKASLARTVPKPSMR